MTHNFTQKEIKGVSTSNGVTVVPRVPARSNVEVRNFEFLPGRLPYQSNTRIEIPMSTLVRAGSYETIKGIYLKVDVGFPDGLAATSDAHINLTPKCILNYIESIKISVDHQELFSFESRGALGTIGHIFNESVLRECGPESTEASTAHVYNEFNWQSPGFDHVIQLGDDTTVRNVYIDINHLTNGLFRDASVLTLGRMLGIEICSIAQPPFCQALYWEYNSGGLIDSLPKYSWSNMGLHLINEVYHENPCLLPGVPRMITAFNLVPTRIMSNLFVAGGIDQIYIGLNWSHYEFIQALMMWGVQDQTGDARATAPLHTWGYSQRRTGIINEMDYARNGESYAHASVAADSYGGRWVMLENEANQLLYGKSHLADGLGQETPFVMAVARGSGWHNLSSHVDETEKAVLYGLNNELPTEWAVTLTGGNAAPACINNQLYYALRVPMVRTITIGKNGFATVTNNVN